MLHVAPSLGFGLDQPLPLPATGAEVGGTYLLAYGADGDAGAQAALRHFAAAQAAVRVENAAHVPAAAGPGYKQAQRQALHRTAAATMRAHMAGASQDERVVAAALLAGSAVPLLGDCSQDSCGACVFGCGMGDCCVCNPPQCGGCGSSGCGQCPCAPTPCSAGGVCGACAAVVSNLSDAVCQEGGTALDAVCDAAGPFAPLCAGAVEGLCDVLLSGGTPAVACSAATDETCC